MLKARPCDRFLIHIIVKHVTELKYDKVRRNHEKPPEIQECPCSEITKRSTGPGVLRSAEMGITSAGMQNRDAECGGHAHTRTVR
ncbi:TPA: hypothetical protein ROI66_004368 [Citrobacter sedlakii]|nr:hypothetical protein [Citrobacter sedlakii]